jgi:PAS domain S-box-containing protein
MNDTHYTILNVDADPTTRQSKSRILQRTGYRAIEAATGLESLRLAHEVCPALVVLCSNLPDMNALEVCRRIKADSKTAGTMVLLISASRATPADRIVSLEGGADAYLAQPAEAEELTAWARALLRLYQREAENRELLAKVWGGEQLLWRMFEQAGEAILICDADARILRASRKARDIAGDALIGKPVDEVFSLEVDTGQPLQASSASIRSELSLFGLCTSGTANNQEICFRRGDGKRFHLLFNCGVVQQDDGDEAGAYVITLTDITARKEAETALQRRNEGLRLLNEASAELLTSSDPRRMIENLFIRVSDYLSADMFFNYMLDEDVPEQTPVLHLEAVGGVEEPAYRSITRLRLGEAVCGTSAQERRVIYIPDVQHSEDPKCAPIAALDVRAYVCFPLVAGERVIGTLSFGSKRKDHFGSEELDFLRALTHHVACAKEWLRAVQSLRKSEEEFRAAFDAAGIGRGNIDLRSGSFIRVNAKLCEILGYSREELIGKSFLDFTHPDDRQRNLQTVQPFFRGEVPVYTIEKRYVRRDGTVIWCSVTGVLIKDSSGNPLAALTEVQDITERKHAEEALRENQARLDLAQKTAKAGVWDWNIADNRATWSEAAWDLFGVPPGSCEATYDLWRNCLHPDDRAQAEAKVASVLADGTDYSTEFRVVTRDGRLLWHASRGQLIRDPSGRPQRLIGINIDITERKQMEDDLRKFSTEMEKIVAERTAALAEANAKIVRELEERTKLEEQLREAQKMESIGTLAGGIAHDFNNTLNIIRAYASLLEEHRCTGEDISEPLKIIDDAVENGAATVRQLLTLASKADVELEPVDINTLIAQVGRIMRQTFPKTIEISLKRTPRLPPAILDRNHIIQALLNLCVNARDAMPLGGQLALSSGVVQLREIREQHPEADAANYVFLEVLDNGEGMDEAVRKRIFDPFFTTKGPGKGTGLGLSVVFGIVKKHEGFIHVESRPHHGTRFRIYLPAAPADKQSVPLHPAHERSLGIEAAGRQGTILIAEDSDSILDILSKRFTQWGLRVLSARDGDAALRVYDRHKDEIDVVLLDIGLPKLSGEQVLSTIKQDNPELPVVVASGYIDPDLKSNLLAAGVKAFVTKPYDLRQLYATIRAALERRAAVPHC